MIRTVKRMLSIEPFFAHILMMCEYKFDNVDESKITIKSSDLSFKLTFNKEVFDALTGEQRIGFLKHNISHVMYKHPLEVEKYGNKKVYGIAADMLVNQYIEEDKLLDHWITLEAINLAFDASIQRNKTTEFYYKEMMKLLNASEENRAAIMSMEPSNDWEVIGEKGLLEDIIDNKIIQATKSAGIVPGEFKQSLDNILKNRVQVLNWKQVLRMYLGANSDSYIKRTLKKPNKRFGENVPAIRRKYKRKILVAIDTSGSVGDDQVMKFFAQIEFMVDENTKVDVLQFDAKVQNVTAYDEFKKRPTIYGRGGTQFQPVIDHYNERNNEYTVCIVLTDGYASTPKKSKGKLLFVITKDGTPEYLKEFNTIQIN